MTTSFSRATVALLLFCSLPSDASAQASIKEVLSGLLTNRSIPTDDFVRDEQAAGATRDAISGFLLAELSTLPISSSSSGFTYRLNPALGTVMRSSDSFGPFFAERALTSGRNQISFGVGYRAASFDRLDGQPVGSSRVDLQACKLEYSIVSPK